MLIPENSVVHFGICNSLRSWNNFLLPDSVEKYSNTGGFGIDGGLSSLVGASLMEPDRLCFGFFGDLLFYYDMNAIGNRDIKSNLRVLIINNGLGQEFKNHSSFGVQFDEDADRFIAAKGHFCARTTPVIKNYAESLNFEYLSAANKDELKTAAERFMCNEMTDSPMLLEVFTETDDESKALDIMISLTGKSKVSTGFAGLIRSPRLRGIRKIVKNYTLTNNTQ